MTLKTSHSFTLRWVERAIAIIDAAGSTFITSAQLAGWWNQVERHQHAKGHGSLENPKDPSSVCVISSSNDFESAMNLYSMLCEEEEGKRKQVDLALYDEWDVLGALALWLKERWKRTVPSSVRGELVDAAITFYEKNFGDGARAKLFSVVTKLEVEALTILRTVAGAVVRSESAGYVDETLSILAEQFRKSDISDSENRNPGVEVIIGPIMFMPYFTRTIDSNGSVLEEHIGNPIASSMALLIFAKVYSEVLFKSSQSKFLFSPAVSHISIMDSSKEKKQTISFLSKFNSSKKEDSSPTMNGTGKEWSYRGSLEPKLGNLETQVQKLQEELNELKHELSRMQQANEGRVQEISETFDFWTQLLLSETRASLSLERAAREKLERRVHRLEEVFSQKTVKGEKLTNSTSSLSRSKSSVDDINDLHEVVPYSGFNLPSVSREESSTPCDEQDDELLQAFQQAVGVSLVRDVSPSRKSSSHQGTPVSEGTLEGSGLRKVHGKKDSSVSNRKYSDPEDILVS
eukprot:jgi/Galph1/3102/GphlegSOOS_G1799.1